MTTEWVVEVPVQRVVLDAQNRGAMLFTVTNAGPDAGQAVLEIVPADGADRSWFAVETSQRLIAAGASVPFRVSIAPPPGAPPGTYFVQARVY